MLLSDAWLENWDQAMGGLALSLQADGDTTLHTEGDQAMTVEVAPDDEEAKDEVSAMDWSEDAYDGFDSDQSQE